MKANNFLIDSLEQNQRQSRRQWLKLAATLGIASSATSCVNLGLEGLAAILSPQLLIRPEMMMKYITPHFPLKKSYKNFASVSFLSPIFEMNPTTNQLRLGMKIGSQIGGSDNIAVGACQIASGVRFDQKTRNLYLKNTVLENIQVPGMTGEISHIIQKITTQVATNILPKYPVYKVPQNSMYKYIRNMQFQNEGLLLSFGV